MKIALVPRGGTAQRRILPLLVFPVKVSETNDNRGRGVTNNSETTFDTHGMLFLPLLLFPVEVNETNDKRGRGVTNNSETTFEAHDLLLVLP
jgi:hypothetical protein